MNEPLQMELAKEAAAHSMWEKGDTILVAVSGGPDSMALLHMLQGLTAEQGIKLVAAHVNHGFRAEESAFELEVVQSIAESLGVPCETIVMDLPSYIEENRLNLQAAARQKRYEFLYRTALQYGASRIALAHHADDQAETVLMRLIRGAGLSGLSGMSSVRREKNVQLIRPLLRMNKSDLLRYCEEHEIPYCVDSSNLARYYFRNTIRLDVIPYLMQFNPQLPQSLQRLAEVAGAEDEWMEQQASEWFSRIVRCGERECQVECRELSSLHVALQRRLIKLILNYLSQDTENITYGAVETMRQAASSHAPATWRMDAAGGIQCLREYGVMRWVHTNARQDMAGGYDYVIEQGSDERIEAAPSGWSFQLEWLETAAEKPSSRMEAYFDVAGLVFPLHVRNRVPGDRIHVLGLNGSKKVQDMFVDEKVPPSRRELYPLLSDGDGKLLWIPGIRRSAHALPGSGSAQVLRITALNE
ncbi:tRNA lysidine(34) synthetase TilS [Paenibacillus sp. 1011MAR3C5]|uniref:tRNA lysidine(34) synthetase TilS n=1 Tax=Paenibacillus sp. 1011MAR3C5 TaxID=1675787 RepID=UPI000E6C77DB|nr:tRNA lysidine(34) synthetase TilS [Paenibacillus sp. 1011MAR3C5]RJE83585.1 tRNA lysidine(34) synthetase TilS [Paenibacillus sp. 1011MAR3C5]